MNNPSSPSNSSSFLIPIRALEKYGPIAVPVLFAIVGLMIFLMLNWVVAGGRELKINFYFLGFLLLAHTLNCLFAYRATSKVRETKGLEIKDGFVYIHQIDRKLKIQASDLKSIEVYPVRSNAFMRITTSKTNYLVDVPHAKSAENELRKLGVDVRNREKVFAVCLFAILGILMLFPLDVTALLPSFLLGVLAFYGVYKLRMVPTEVLFSYIAGVFLSVLSILLVVPIKF